MDLSFEQFYAKHWDAVESFCRNIHKKQAVAFSLSLNAFAHLQNGFEDLPEEQRAYTRLLIIARAECVDYATQQRQARLRWQTRLRRWILNYLLLEHWSRRLIFGKK